MKYLEADRFDECRGRPIGRDDTFCFRCHPDIACFNRCCRNLNLFLYPYDVIRLRQALGISSDEFLDQYVDIVLRPSSYFPEVLLHMSETAEKACPFLTQHGCRVYADRPDTCRSFPIERGIFFDAVKDAGNPVYFYRPPDFCMGPREGRAWTVDQWLADQDAHRHDEMTRGWAEFIRLFQTDPWGPQGPRGSKAKMTFMATYNIDRFRQFVFQSTFLSRYTVPSRVVERIHSDDADLLLFAMAWVKLLLWGIPSNEIVPRK
jgi:Fe-S-cluster containining protein